MSLDPPAATRHAAVHARRMNRVLDHIDAHLDVELDLATLAAVAHFSPFHFHRVFSAWMGETLGDYLRRRRLDHAALVLAANARRTVLEVALAVGFGSGEAFARAFKQRFGCTPSAWREATPQRWQDELAEQRRRFEQRKAGQAQRKDDQAGAAILGEDGGIPLTETSMDVTIKTLPATRVAYLRHIGPYGQPVSEFWQRVAMPWLKANGHADGPLYGIGRDDPCVTAADKCRYDVCCPIPDGAVPAAPAGVDTLPGGRYAVAPFFGDSTDIAHAYTELLRDWLPASGFRVDDRPIYEYYRPNPRYEPETGRFECELCVPVRPA
jgi:AraC family transcriptional regulator